MTDFLNMVLLKVESVPTKFDWTIHLDNIDIGVMITVLGVLVVFAVLLAIYLLLAIFSMVMQDKKKPAVQPKPAVRPTPPVAPVKTEVSDSTEELMDDKELVAIISATIAAAMDTSVDNFVVRRIRRNTTWNKEAIEEQQYGLY